jgi:poly(A) polymerase
LNDDSTVPAASQVDTMTDTPSETPADPHAEPPRETSEGTKPRIVPRSDHRISRKGISDEALKVLYRLSSLGFKAYLVGGGVRDLYLGKKPKDFDVCTDAKPSRLKKIFRNCRIIGRRFRIAHIFFPGDQIVEVATFRRGEVHRITKESGVILLDNEYGTPEEDARRRDLTINGLFYDIATHSIIDYVGGVEDLDSRRVRTINDPDRSFIEDPVRMIRTLRHAVRTGFEIEENTLQAVYRNRQEIAKANPSRLMEEVFRDLRGGASETFFRRAMETHLLDEILPVLATQLREVGPDHPMWRRLRSLDRWSAAGREVSNAPLLAVLLHTVLLPEPGSWTGERGLPADVWRVLMRNFAECAAVHLRISRRDAERVAQILISFRKLLQCYGRGFLPPTFQKKPYLVDALDFLEAELLSRDQPIDRIVHWRRDYAPAAAEEEKRAFGEGGFIDRGRGRRGRGGAPGWGRRGGGHPEEATAAIAPEHTEVPLGAEHDDLEADLPDIPPEGLEGPGTPEGEERHARPRQQPPREGAAPAGPAGPEGEGGEKRRRRRHRGGRRRSHRRNRG